MKRPPTDYLTHKPDKNDLIAEICNVLGWEIDEGRMEAEIQRVDVYADRIEVTAAAQEESA